MTKISNFSHEIVREQIIYGRINIKSIHLLACGHKIHMKLKKQTRIKNNSVIMISVTYSLHLDNTIHPKCK